MIWFTGDQHFSHENIIEYCDRPFTSVVKMNQVLISRYRQVVKEEDTIYFLGDFTLFGPQHRSMVERLIEQLPGTKILILGNHDKLAPFTYIDAGFQSVHTSLDIGEFMLVHDPALCLAAKNRKWLCGHVHQLFTMNRKGNVLNVGVDVHGFFPITIEEVRHYFEKQDTAVTTLV